MLKQFVVFALFVGSLSLSSVYAVTQEEISSGTNYVVTVDIAEESDIDWNMGQGIVSLRANGYAQGDGASSAEAYAAAQLNYLEALEYVKGRQITRLELLHMVYDSTLTATPGVTNSQPVSGYTYRHRIDFKHTWVHHIGLPYGPRTPPRLPAEAR